MHLVVHTVALVAQSHISLPHLTARASHAALKQARLLAQLISCAVSWNSEVRLVHHRARTHHQANDLSSGCSLDSLCFPARRIKALPDSWKANWGENVACKIAVPILSHCVWRNCGALFFIHPTTCQRFFCYPIWKYSPSFRLWMTEENFTYVIISYSLGPTQQSGIRRFVYRT